MKKGLLEKLRQEKTRLKQENTRLRIKIERQALKLDRVSLKLEQAMLALKKKIDKREREIVELKHQKDGATVADIMASLPKQGKGTRKN